MKKILIVISCIIGLVLGALLLWKVVFPFLGFVLGKIFSLLASLVALIG